MDTTSDTYIYLLEIERTEDEESVTVIKVFSFS